MPHPYDDLRTAVSTGEAAEVEKVLARRIFDLDAPDTEGHTVLQRAISSGYLDVVQVLLAYGADPNVRGSDGLPALNHALGLNMGEIVDVLILQGAKMAALPSNNAGEPLAAAWLIFTDGDLLRSAPLTPPSVVIGSDPERCDVALKEFGISRRHARIDVGPDGQMTLTDLKSKNGSRVNSRVAMVEAPITVGDRLWLGKVVFVVVGSLTAAPRAVESATPGVHELSALAARPGVTLEEKVAWIDGICARLAAAHAEGVVHGDLHGRRIRAAPDGRVEIDFAPKSTPGPSLSPEQLVGGPADTRSDVFAAACIAYQLLAGRPPFEGESLFAMIYRVLHEDPLDPRQLAPSLPEALAAWLKRGLAKAPAERFADGGEMLEALRRVLASRATVPRAGSPASELEQARATRDYGRLIGILESRLRSNPQDWNAMQELGHALVATGRPAEVVPHIIAVCDMFARDGFFKHARGLLKAAERVDPANPDVVSRLDAWEGK